MQKNSNEITKIFKLYVEAQQPGPAGKQVVQKAAPLVADLNQSTSAEVSNVSPDLYDILQHDKSDPTLQELIDTDLPQINYKQFGLYLDLSYASKQPLLIYGEPGLGKSAYVKQYTLDAAKAKNKKPIFWNQSDKQTKEKVIQTPSEYFVLIDIRTAQLDPTDIMGIPIGVTSNSDYLETKQMQWIYLLSKPDSDGILFLDEINQGSPQVLKALFEVVFDRSAGGTGFSKHFAIVGAGNLGNEHGNEPIPPALANRFTCGTLIADPQGWLDWAESHNLNPYIIGFVKSNPSENFYVKPKNPSDPFPSPRQMEKFSLILDTILSKYHNAKLAGTPIKEPIINTISNQAAGLCGVYWARKFVTYLQYIQNFSIQNILDNPNLKKEKADKLHALVSFLTSKVKYALTHIQAGVTKNKDAADIINALIHVTVTLNPEWRNIIWSSITRTLNLDQKKEIFGFINNLELDPNVDRLLKDAFKQLGQILKGE